MSNDAKGTEMDCWPASAPIAELEARARQKPTLSSDGIPYRRVVWHS
jgi:hypothetical protein